MAQLLIRNLDESVKRALKRQAERHGRSLEAEARAVLTAAAAREAPSAAGFGTRLAQRFAPIAGELQGDFPEWRDPLPPPIDLTS